MIRIGHGYDVHRFAEEKQGSCIVLGGVEIPSAQPLLAHSDGDVLLHALSDAMLGAIAAGDIGQHFPDSDPAYAGISSRLLLEKVAALLAEAGFELVNIDATIIAQSPKMAPHIPAMRENIAADLNLELSAINIKATTTEGLGFAGRKEGIAVHVVCLVVRDS